MSQSGASRGADRKAGLHNEPSGSSSLEAWTSSPIHLGSRWEALPAPPPVAPLKNVSPPPPCQGEKGGSTYCHS